MPHSTKDPVRVAGIWFVFPLTLLLLLMFPSTTMAQEWTWPDGKVAFRAPPATRFTQNANAPAPALARWSTADGLTMVAAIQMAHSSDTPLEQQGLETGTLNQLPQGVLVSSSRSTLSGVPAYTIVARTDASGSHYFIAQVVVAFGGQGYKLMLASPSDPMLDADLASLLRSVRILAPAPVAPSPRAAANPHDLSVRIGEWGFWFLLAALALYFLRPKRRANHAPPGPPS